MFNSLSTRVHAMPHLAPILLAGLLLAVCATAASAEPGVRNDDGSMSERVSSHGLDLATQPAQASMKQRIEMAVRRVCGSDDQGDMGSRTAYEACHTDAMADAMGQLTTLVARANGNEAVVVALADTQQ